MRSEDHVHVAHLGDGGIAVGRVVGQFLAQVRLHDQTAGLGDEPAVAKDSAQVTAAHRFTDTWVRRNGRWQCAANHISPIR